MPSTESRPRGEPTPVDPRPGVSEHDGVYFVAGQRCTSCGYPIVIEVARCPRCAGEPGRLGEMAPAQFGPHGRVWSSTVLRIPMPPRATPYVIAWVDLDGGPRILAHVLGTDDRHLPVGSAVMLTARSPVGDLQVRPADAAAPADPADPADPAAAP